MSEDPPAMYPWDESEKETARRLCAGTMAANAGPAERMAAANTAIARPRRTIFIRITLSNHLDRSCRIIERVGFSHPEAKQQANQSRLWMFSSTATTQA